MFDSCNIERINGRDWIQTPLLIHWPNITSVCALAAHSRRYSATALKLFPTSVTEVRGMPTLLQDVSSRDGAAACPRSCIPRGMGQLPPVQHQRGCEGWPGEAAAGFISLAWKKIWFKVLFFRLPPPRSAGVRVIRRSAASCPRDGGDRRGQSVPASAGNDPSSPVPRGSWKQSSGPQWLPPSTTRSPPLGRGASRFLDSV